MRILTCNIRYFGAKDGDNGWAHRKDLCARVIRSRHPDVICFQEMWAEQFADLAAAFEDFETFGMVDEPTGRHPMNAIFYRRDAFRRISSGGYWLSQTPHVPGSRSWDSVCVRLANWLRLEERVHRRRVPGSQHAPRSRQPACAREPGAADRRGCGGIPNRLSAVPHR